jgi:hypothetical protein
MISAFYAISSLVLNYYRGKGLFRSGIAFSLLASENLLFENILLLNDD